MVYAYGMTENREAAERIAVAVTEADTEWVRIEDIAKATGLTPAELGTAIADLLQADGFRAESQPFGHRITEWDRQHAPVIGGEPRHLVSWE